jgi:MHS family proline/betaine transporter-like MFS transporter
MAIPTTVIGIIPSYQSIGIFAPVILVLLRIIQGFSAGGQFSGLIAIAVDSESKRKAFLVSLINSISVIGCFIASFVGFLSIEFFSLFHGSDEILRSLNWRTPFLLSGITFLVYLKLKPAFEKYDYDPEHKFHLKKF